jgi:hypothetical protein
MHNNEEEMESTSLGGGRRDYSRSIICELDLFYILHEYIQFIGHHYFLQRPAEGNTSP